MSANNFLKNPLAIVTDNPWHDYNKVGYVNENSSNIPSDCSYGIREVYLYSANSIVVRITGVSKDGKQASWLNYFNGTMWNGWHRQLADKDLQFINKVQEFFGELTYFDDIVVYGHGCAVKNEITKKLDLHIQAQIMSDGTATMHDDGFISIEKLKSLIGVNAISFTTKQSTVNITNEQGGTEINIGEYAGYSGLTFHQSGSLCRFYNKAGAVGTWELRNIKPAMQKGLVYNIDVYGATYS